jgi:cyanate lyase
MSAFTLSSTAAPASARVAMRGSDGAALRRAAAAPARSATTARSASLSVRAGPLTRNDVTETIVFNRMKKGITWASLAEAVGKSLPWTTSALLGQHQMTPEQAKAAGDMLGLNKDEQMLLTYVPYKGSFGKPGELVPTDPLIYRFYEMVMVYGPTYKEMIHEEFGDGIMSAIDFDMDFARLPNEAGDRVKIVLTGKYLTYKSF